MSSASISPAAVRGRRKLSIRRLAAWLAACAVDPKRGLWLVIGLAAVHAVLWTLILVRLKAGQDVHMDVAEAYAWGQKFLFGYGKHPPLSGWVAGVWFKIFPVTDWATYALAMATLGCGLVVCWLLALRVVDRRRAFFVVLMLALYPIFNFKGFKYNPDLLQLVTMPLLVLAYLDAFEKRSFRSGAWLGLAGALALMTKYWALTMIGAIGLAALIHPARLQLLRSPAPWVAIVTLVVAMLPHLVWLQQVNFAPLTYAGESYAITDRGTINALALGYVGHNLALLALPVLLAALALAWPPRRWWLFAFWSRGATAGVNFAQALNVWIIQAVLAIGPPLGAMASWSTSRATGAFRCSSWRRWRCSPYRGLRLRRIALFNLAASWLRDFADRACGRAEHRRARGAGAAQRGRLPGAVRTRARADRVVAHAVSSALCRWSQPMAIPTRS